MYVDVSLNYVQIKKPTGEDGSHRVACRTATWKERRNHHIMISKQQSIMMKPSGTKFSGDTIVPQADLRMGTASNRIIKKEVNK